MSARPAADVFSVTLKLAQILFTGGTITTHYIREEFGVSRATAKRYMVRLESALPVVVENIPCGWTDRFGTCKKRMRLMQPTAAD